MTITRPRGRALPIWAAAVLVASSGCTSGHHAATGSSASLPVRASATPGLSGAPSASRAPGATVSTQAPSGGAEGAVTASSAQCKIASTAALITAFEAKLGAVTASATTTSQLCQVQLISSNVGAGVTIYLSQYQAATRQGFDATKKAALTGGAMSVPGVGDDAYFTPSAVNLQYLSGAVAGSAQARLPGTASAVRISQAKADLIRLARAVVANQ